MNAIIWLHNDGRISSLFPSYLLRALNILDCQYTQDIQEANVVIGGRNLGLVPEHFAGSVFGAGLDRKTIRTFPLMKIGFLLGRKTGECILRRNATHFGDPLLLADLVLERLSEKPPRQSRPGLFVVDSREEIKQLEEWPWVRTAIEQKELEIMAVAEQTATKTVPEILDKIYGRPFVVATDPDVIAIACSFSIPCSPATFSSGDMFVWRDLYSVLGDKMPMIRRLKPDLVLRDLISWCAGKTIPLGDLKLAKSNIQQLLLQAFKVSAPKRGIVVAPVVPVVRKPRRSRSLTRKPAPPPIPPDLSQTGTFAPLQLGWVTTQSSPGTTSSAPVSTRSEAHVRSRSTSGRKIISVATPK